MHAHKLFAAVLISGALFCSPGNATLLAVSPSITHIITYNSQVDPAHSHGVFGSALFFAEDGGGFFANGSIALVPSPHEIAFASANSPGAAEATTYIDYFFAVVGPSGIDVPLIISASAAVSATTVGSVGTVQAIALLTLGFNDPTPVYTAEACLDVHGSSCLFSSSFSFLKTIMATSNHEDNIQLSLNLTANPLAVGASAIVSGYIDPIITIDPTFLRAKEFSLIFSSGVGNSPLALVPEPISLSVLGGAVVSLLAVRGRRRS